MRNSEETIRDLKGNSMSQSVENGDKKPKVPEEIKSHSVDYLDRSWEDYTFEELGQFVHLLAKRAGHRAETKKRQKDLYDAQNYLRMMQAKLDALYPLIPRIRPCLAA